MPLSFALLCFSKPEFRSQCSKKSVTELYNKVFSNRVATPFRLLFDSVEFGFMETDYMEIADNFEIR